MASGKKRLQETEKTGQVMSSQKKVIYADVQLNLFVQGPGFAAQRMVPPTSINVISVINVIRTDPTACPKALLPVSKSYQVEN